MNSRGIKAKGREAENAVVEYLNAHGHRTERRRLMGVEDCGDIAGIFGWVIEVKSEKRIDLPGYLSELAREIKASDKRMAATPVSFNGHTGVVIVKKRGTTDVGQWYAVMPVSQWVADL